MGKKELILAVEKIIEAFERNAGPAWKIQALQPGEESPCMFYSTKKIRQFETSWKIGLLALHPMTNTDRVFQWTEEGILSLLTIIKQWIEITQPRRNTIWKEFIKAKGVFLKTEKKKTCYSGKSFFPSRRSEGKWDEWVDRTYWVGEIELEPSEYEWLKSRSEKIPPPNGFYRVPNDTNDLRPVIFPREKNILEVWGKTGRSRRGVSPMGVMFRGRPEKCPISPLEKWAKKWTLNGKEIYPSDFNFQEWNNPIYRAKRAFKESGIKPEEGEIEALAKAYKQ